MNLKLLVIILAGLIFTSPSFSDSNGIWTYAEDIVGGEFGADENSTNFTFNDVVYFNGDILTNSIIDITNSSYRLNLSGVNKIHRIEADRYFSIGSSAYYLNPAGTSQINNLEVVNSLRYNGTSIDNIFVKEGQPNSINSDMIVDNSIGASDIDSNQIQQRVTGRCSGEFAVREIKQDGTVECREIDDLGLNSLTCPENNFLTGFDNLGNPICKDIRCGDRFNGDTWSDSRTCSYSCGKSTCSGTQNMSMMCIWGEEVSQSGWSTCS